MINQLFLIIVQFLQREADDVKLELENIRLENISGVIRLKLEENIINSLNQNVKFIYKGKIYQDESVLLSTLENPPFGITL